MFAIVQNGQIIKTIQAHTEFELNGKHYNSKWTARMNAEEKAALGISDIVYGPRPDERFYWVTSNGLQLVDGVPTETYSSTPKDLAALQTQYVAQFKAQANNLLAATDWMVIRKAERGVEIPAEAVTERADIIAECARLEAAVTAATTVEELAAAVGTAYQVEAPAEEVVISGASAMPV